MRQVGDTIAGLFAVVVFFAGWVATGDFVAALLGWFLLLLFLGAVLIVVDVVDSLAKGSSTLTAVVHGTPPRATSASTRPTAGRPRRWSISTVVSRSTSTASTDPARVAGPLPLHPRGGIVAPLVSAVAQDACRLPQHVLPAVPVDRIAHRVAHERAASPRPGDFVHLGDEGAIKLHVHSHDFSCVCSMAPTIAPSHLQAHLRIGKDWRVTKLGNRPYDDPTGEASGGAEPVAPAADDPGAWT